MSFRKLVMPKDLNPSNRLFGGRMMEWLDEAAAIYASCKLDTDQLVTLKVSELLFQNPGHQGDIIEFFCSTEAAGDKSFTVKVVAKTKPLGNYIDTDSKHIVTANIIFVAIDNKGRTVPHNYKEE